MAQHRLWQLPTFWFLVPTDSSKEFQEVLFRNGISKVGDDDLCLFVRKHQLGRAWGVVWAFSGTSSRRAGSTAASLSLSGNLDLIIFSKRRIVKNTAYHFVKSHIERVVCGHVLSCYVRRVTYGLITYSDHGLITYSDHGLKFPACK